MSFEFISFRQNQELIDHRYYYDEQSDITYLPFDYNKSVYANQKQLLDYITEIQRRVDYPVYSELPVEYIRQMKENYIPKGECPCFSNALQKIHTYFTRYNLSLEKFLQVYPMYTKIFDENIPVWDRFKTFAGNYVSLEQSISNKNTYK